MASFKVMTWNVENLFPEGTRISPQSRRTVTREEFAAKIAFLSHHIQNMNPDVLALQELGGENDADARSLEALSDALANVYPHSAVGKPDSRHTKVAILSKLSLSGVEPLVDFPPGPFAQVPNHDGRPPFSQMGRGAVSVEVAPQPGIRIRLVAAHLKSKLLTYPSNNGVRFSPADENERAVAMGIALARRSAEAITIRQHAAGRMIAEPDTQFIVLGDFNDGPAAATSQLLLGPSDGDVSRPDQHDPVRLYNLTDGIPLRGDAERVFLPSDERFSRRHEGKGEMLDQILASRSLVFGNGEFRVQSVRSFVHLIEGQSISNNPSERHGKEASDHAPVMAEFEI